MMGQILWNKIWHWILSDYNKITNKNTKTKPNKFQTKKFCKDRIIIEESSKFQLDFSSWIINLLDYYQNRKKILYIN